MNKRDYDSEFKSTSERKYAYNFDYLMHNFMLRRFKPFINGGSCLELGCFEGKFTERLLSLYSKVEVVEASKVLIDKCSENLCEYTNQLIFHHSTFESVELNSTFDAIFLIHTLEHLDDPKRTLKKINSWLSDKGKLFLVVPNANAASRQIAVSMGIIDHNACVTAGEKSHGHRKTYSLDTLVSELSDTGLNIIDQGGVLFKPLANFQFDAGLESKTIDLEYMEGCYKLGFRYPDLCASIFCICERESN